MIYFLSILGGDYIKIGYTSQPISKRKAALQTGNPYEIDVLFCIDGSLQDEKTIHKELKCVFDRLNISDVPPNEWYPGSSPIIKTFVDSVHGDGLVVGLQTLRKLNVWNTPIKNKEVFSIRALEKALRANGYSRSQAKSIISINKEEFMEKLTHNAVAEPVRPKVILRKGGGKWQSFPETLTATSL